MMRLEKPWKHPSFFPVLDTDAWDEDDARIIEAVRVHRSIAPCTPALTSEPFRQAVGPRASRAPLFQIDDQWQAARARNITAARVYGHWPTRMYRTDDPHVWVEVLPHGHRTVDLRSPQEWIRENPVVRMPILFQAAEIAATRVKT